MAVHELPSPETLRQLLDYDPETGELTWKPKSAASFEREGKHTATRVCNAWNRLRAGKAAFTTIGNHGYKSGRICYKAVLAHRVAYAIHYGEWPTGMVDHINGNRLDNRIANLRCVDNCGNAQNQAIRKTNVSGASGVWRHPNGRWRAQIRVNGVYKHLGYFSEFADAAAARKDAERECGFHPNHGSIRARSDQPPPAA